MDLSIENIESKVTLYKEDEDILEQNERLFHYRRLGMKKMEKLAWRGILSKTIYLMSNGKFRLLQNRCMYSDLFAPHMLASIGFDGISLPEGSFRRVSFRKFKGNIPLEVLRSLPDDAPDKAIIFEKSKDPILAYPIQLTRVGFWGRKRFPKLWIQAFKWN